MISGKSPQKEVNMFNFASLNQESKKTIRDGVNLEEMKDFIKLEKYIGKELLVDGFFFTKSKYGEQVVIVADGHKINIPKRFTTDFKAIRDNDEALKQVIEGHLKLVNIRALDAKEGKTVTFDYANA
jgi:hypothetical protein